MTKPDDPRPDMPVGPDRAGHGHAARARRLARIALLVPLLLAMALLAGGIWLSLNYPAQRAQELVTLIARSGPDAAFPELSHPYQREIGRERWARFIRASGLDTVTASRWQRRTVAAWLRPDWTYPVSGEVTLANGRHVPARMMLGRPCKTCPSAAIWSIEVAGRRP